MRHVARCIGGTIVDHHDFTDLWLRKGGTNGDIDGIRCILCSDDDANGL